MPKLNVASGSLVNYEVLNPDAEECVVLIHGMFGNLSQFYLTIAPFLAQHYKVVIFDLKSHGRSEKSESGYDLVSLSNDVKELMDALSIQKSSLLGFSYGALVALKFAMLNPARTTKVVAIEVPDKPIHDFKKRGTYTFDDFWGFVIYLNTNIRENFFRSKRQIENTFKVYDYIFNQTTFSDDMNAEPEFVESDYKMVKSPVLLAFGKASPCFGEFNRIKNWIKNADIYLDDGDHGFFMDKVEASSSRVISFLAAPVKSESVPKILQDA
ncbi:MAG: esterase [Flavobacteriales bacterium]|jgi:esterase